MQKYKIYTIFQRSNAKRILTANVVNSQLCMSGCSVQAWLNTGKMPRNPAHKRVLKKVSTQSRISWI